VCLTCLAEDDPGNFQTIQSCPKAPCQHSSDRDTDIANLTADLAAERAEVAQLRGWHSEMLQYAAGRDAVITRLSAEVERLRVAGDALAEALRAMTRLGAPPDMNEWVTWQLSVADPALNTYMGGPS
jgi:hypothetical protein